MSLLLIVTIVRSQDSGDAAVSGSISTIVIASLTAKCEASTAAPAGLW